MRCVRAQRSQPMPKPLVSPNHTDEYNVHSWMAGQNRAYNVCTRCGCKRHQVTRADGWHYEYTVPGEGSMREVPLCTKKFIP